MTEITDLSMLEETIQVAHEFEVDLHCFVANHKATIEGIERIERDDMAAAEQEARSELDYEMASSILSYHQNYFDDRKVAARNLALVALITRLQHWASVYARRIDRSRKRGKSLKTELGFLSSNLGAGPVSLDFFLKLVDVRDSVIHADSQPNWVMETSKGPINRSVDPQYAPNSWRVEISETDLSEAVEKATAQIVWYDEKLRTLGK